MILDYTAKSQPQGHPANRRGSRVPFPGRGCPLLCFRTIWERSRRGDTASAGGRAHRGELRLSVEEPQAQPLPGNQTRLAYREQREHDYRQDHDDNACNDGEYKPLDVTFKLDDAQWGREIADEKQGWDILNDLVLAGNNTAYVTDPGSSD